MNNYFLIFSRAEILNIFVLVHFHKLFFLSSVQNKQNFYYYINTDFSWHGIKTIFRSVHIVGIRYVNYQIILQLTEESVLFSYAIVSGTRSSNTATMNTYRYLFRVPVLFVQRICANTSNIDPLGKYLPLSRKLRMLRIVDERIRSRWSKKIRWKLLSENSYDRWI